MRPLALALLLWSANGGVIKLDGYPWARLNRKGAQLTEHTVKLEPTIEASLGVHRARAFIAEPPRVILYVFEFETQKAALAAVPKLTATLERSGELHHPKTTVTGAYLLVAGVPGEEPPSPEMKWVLTDYISAFAGRE